MKKNIFVFGFDDYNYEHHLKKLEETKNVEFIPLFTFAEIQTERKMSVVELYKAADKKLSEFEGSIDGIITFWDYPAPLIVPLLNEKYTGHGNTFEDALKCEHKYYSRLTQREAGLKEAPDFDTFDPYDEVTTKDIKLDFPYWIKPIKGYLSQLSYKIESEEDFQKALVNIRKKAKDLCPGFDEFMEYVDAPEVVREVKGYHFIAEEDIRGDWQGSLEAYMYEGKYYVNGVIDTITYPDSAALFCLHYPSKNNPELIKRIEDAGERAIRAMGWEDGAFNMEYFYNSKTDELFLLEINPRISQSHSSCFHFVDGKPHQRVLVDIALGNEHEPIEGEGKWNVSGKFTVRTFEDGLVTKAASPAEIREIMDSMEGVTIKNDPPAGMLLSEIPNQDNHSYLLVEAFIGANSESELYDKLKTVMERLPVKIRPVDQQAAVQVNTVASVK